jgi:putative ABC transport system permease protein
MTVAAETRAAPPRRIVLPLPLRLALRDLRGGLSGFYILIGCIALGVAAIAAVNTVSSALENAISREGRVLLGGDMEASVIHRRATPEERALIAPWGDVSEIATLRGMARREDGSRQALVDMKAVDGVYPLYGRIELEGGAALADALKQGAAVDAGLAAQLDVRVGDAVLIGQTKARIAAIIKTEPDRLSGGPGFGPRMMISLETLSASQLDEPGSLIRWHYRVKFADGSAGAAFRDGPGKTLTAAGFTLRDRNDPSPGIRRNIERLTSFLTLAGLVALLTGGLGVANAVAAFVERKRRVIAAYKALGASAALVNQAMILHVMMLACLGVVIGLAVGALAPAGVIQFAGPLLPVRLDASFDAAPALLAAIYGLLTALAFILWPLGRASEVRAADLLRENVAPGRGWPSRRFVLASALSAAGLLAAAIVFSSEPLIALWVCLGMSAVFALFYGYASLIRRAAAVMPKGGRAEINWALRAIARPGGLTRIVAVSLGAGLTLLTAIALIGTSLTKELTAELPDKAPSHFFLGIPKRDFTAFSETVAKAAPGSTLRQAPMLRGRMVDIAGTPVEKLNPPEQAEWVLRGDRGLTFEAAPPKDSQIIEGAWWAPDHAGEPLVSFEVELGRALGLRIGDEITVNVLGRNITARLANLRTVDWQSLDINFVMIFSPNTLKDAPYSILATLDWPGDRDAQEEAKVVTAVTAAFPAVTALRVRDALETVNRILSRLLLAIQAAAGVTLAAGIIVLAGALATAQQRRIYEAVILKTLGATRGRILLATLTEQALLALAVAGLACVFGAAASYVIVTQIFGAPFYLSLTQLLQVCLITTILMCGVWRDWSVASVAGKGCPLFARGIGAPRPFRLVLSMRAFK